MLGKIKHFVALSETRYKRCLDAAQKVSAITGESKLFLLAEIVFSWFIYGASEEDFMVMEFYRKNSREKKRWMTSKKNNRYILDKVYDKASMQIFDNKDLFDKTFAKYIKHDFLITWESTEDKIIEFIKKYGVIIVKPADGACGRGIYKLLATDTAGIAELLKSVASGKKLIIEQVIIQHPEMHKMNSYSVNTIRVITMLDKNGEVHIISQLVKFGASNKCISNTLGGGLCCHIDPATGIIDAKGKDIYGRAYFKHPVSGYVIPGFQIPNWSGVLDYAKELARVVPSGRYIGWDIVILEDGYDIIEGNIHPGQDFQGCDGIGRWNQIKSLI